MRHQPVEESHEVSRWRWREGGGDGRGMTGGRGGDCLYNSCLFFYSPKMTVFENESIVRGVSIAPLEKDVYSYVICLYPGRKTSLRRNARLSLAKKIVITL